MNPVKRIWHQIINGELQMVAAALSFSTVLSLIPFLAVTLATIQYFDGFISIYPKVEGAVLSYLHGPAGEDGIVFIQKIFKRVHAGKMGGVGAVALIFTSVLLLRDMESGIHRVWNLPNKRSLHKRIFYYWLLLVSFPVLLAMIVAITSVKITGNFSLVVPLEILRFGLLWLTLFIVNKVVPNVKVPVLSAMVGALVSSAGLWVLFKSFKWITQTFFRLDKVYGSVATIPTLLLWILFIWYVVLFGAAVTASFSGKQNDLP